MDLRALAMAMVGAMAVSAGCEGLQEKRYPLRKDGYPHLRFKGFAESECSPETSQARVLRVVRETQISWEDLESLPFHWNGKRELYRPEGATTRGGVTMVQGQPRPFGLLCVGNLLIDGKWEWGPDGLLLRQGTTLKHPWPADP